MREPRCLATSAALAASRRRWNAGGCSGRLSFWRTFRPAGREYRPYQRRPFSRSMWCLVWEPEDKKCMASTCETPDEPTGRTRMDSTCEWPPGSRRATPPLASTTRPKYRVEPKPVRSPRRRIYAAANRRLRKTPSRKSDTPYVMHGDSQEHVAAKLPDMSDAA